MRWSVVVTVACRRRRLRRRRHRRAAVEPLPLCRCRLFSSYLPLMQIPSTLRPMECIGSEGERELSIELLELGCCAWQKV